jgi:hypothetical protein
VVRTVFQGQNEKDAQGNAVVQPDRIERAFQHAASIGADPNSGFANQVRGLPAGGPPLTHATPTMRARTYGEAIRDRIRDAYATAASSLPGQLGDLLGASNLRGMAEGQDTRDMGDRLGILYPGPLEPGAGAAGAEAEAGGTLAKRAAQEAAAAKRAEREAAGLAKRWPQVSKALDKSGDGLRPDGEHHSPEHHDEWWVDHSPLDWRNRGRWAYGFYGREICQPKREDGRDSAREVYARRRASFHGAARRRLGEQP